MDRHLVSYYIGISIIFASHIYLITGSQMTTHAYINLIAALLIAYYFTAKEGFIYF